MGPGSGTAVLSASWPRWRVFLPSKDSTIPLDSRTLLTPKIGPMRAFVFLPLAILACGPDSAPPAAPSDPLLTLWQCHDLVTCCVRGACASSRVEGAAFCVGTRAEAEAQDYELCNGVGAPECGCSVTCTAVRACRP